MSVRVLFIFSFIRSFIFYILACLLSLLILKSLLPQPPSLSTFPLFLFRKRQNFHGYRVAMAYQVPVRLGTVSSIKPGKGNPIGGKVHKRREQSQRQPLLPLLGVLQEDRLHNHNMCRRARSVIP